MTKTTFELPWWYRQVPRDFMSSPDVEIMTCEEVGSYFLLLQKAWLGGENCTLPNDPARLAKLARVEKVSDLVLSKFDKDKDGKLYNPRLKQEWDNAVKRSKDATRSANSRWENGMRPHSDRNATALPAQYDGNATKTKTKIQTKTKTKLKTVQGHTEADSATNVASASASPSPPAKRVAEKLAAILGRTNLKPATMQAWAVLAEGITAEHGEQAVLDVMNQQLVERSDGFWRGRVFGMKNFVKSFKTMLTQTKNRVTSIRKAADPLAERAASLKTGHDFSALAKGDL